METLRIPPGYKAELILTPLQPDGEPAAIDGAPSYEIGAPELASIIEEDGVTKLVAGDVEGETTLTVRADVRLGEGESLREKTYILLVAEEASQLNVAFGPIQYAGIE